MPRRTSIPSLETLRRLPIRTREEAVEAERIIAEACVKLAKHIKAERVQVDLGTWETRASRGRPADLRRLTEMLQLRSNLHAALVINAVPERPGHVSEVKEAMQRTEKEFWQCCFADLQRLHDPFDRNAKGDHDLTAAIVRLHDEILPTGKQRTWKEVGEALRDINPSWCLKASAIRKRYSRSKLTT